MAAGKAMLKEAMTAMVYNGSSGYINSVHLTPPTTPNRGAGVLIGVKSPDIRMCFNCNQNGHIASRCTAPCGKCNQRGHQRRECTVK